MKNYLIYFIIVFGVTACGSRKVDTDISKQSGEVKQSDQTKSDERTEDKSQSSKKDETKNDITDTETVKTTTTEYGQDGKPTKTTTTETTRNKTDKSTRNKNETVTEYRTHEKHSLANRDIVKTVTIKEKSKKSEANNWGLPALGIVAVLGVLLWLWFKFKK